MITFVQRSSYNTVLQKALSVIGVKLQMSYHAIIRTKPAINNVGSAHFTMFTCRLIVAIIIYATTFVQQHIFHNKQKSQSFKGPSWINTDAPNWCTDPWQIAKCYLSKDGYKDVNQAEDTDFNKIINFILQLWIRSNVLQWWSYANGKCVHQGTVTIENKIQ